MRKYGESKTTRIMMAMYRTSLLVLDLENFKPKDFCWTECTVIVAVTAALYNISIEVGTYLK